MLELPVKILPPVLKNSNFDIIITWTSPTPQLQSLSYNILIQCANGTYAESQYCNGSDLNTIEYRNCTIPQSELV